MLHIIAHLVILPISPGHFLPVGPIGGHLIPM
ncbi:hypothetical protein Sulac_1115 [Sulfobacillus acidophilus DSM 10332]|uniref:Uncharacterized protein n=1 Tax=Sulfobacillus acidophilus (strain ATCC 700253 / DSM 10332 / NAL) TaxID=679936 RepID=G8TU24_SULAD|nr:hypothetical protein Sulac_1115 [Sulfobacillus acidophilus DSM 10332]